jgi:glycosyltransferase involved in cell wall biosynthesis
VPIALVTNYLTAYRVPLYERLARQHGLEVLCYGGGERYVPAWFSDLDAQIAAAPFPARRIKGAGAAFAAAARYEAVIAPFAGGVMLPAAYAGAATLRKPFILWASVWAQPRSAAHALALPLTRRIYRNASAVVAYGEHVKRFVSRIRGRDEDVFVAPQAVEPELFARHVSADEQLAFRREHGLAGRVVLYVGRLVPEKGVGVLLDAWPSVRARISDATLVLIGDGELAERAAWTPGARFLGSVSRERLAVVYAASELTVVPSIPTPRFKEPWGLVCNEAMHQGRPVIATEAVGAAAGGLVVDGVTGRVLAPGDPHTLANAIVDLLSNRDLAATLGEAARHAVAGYTYDAMVDAFERALLAAGAERRRHG